MRLNWDEFSFFALGWHFCSPVPESAEPACPSLLASHWFCAAKVSERSRMDHRVPSVRFMWSCVFSEIQHAPPGSWFEKFRLLEDLKRGFNEPNSSHSSTFRRTITLFAFLGNFTLIPIVQIAFSIHLIHPKHVDDWQEINNFQIQGINAVVQLGLILQDATFCCQFTSVLSS